MKNSIPTPVSPDTPVAWRGSWAQWHVTPLQASFPVGWALVVALLWLWLTLQWSHRLLLLLAGACAMLHWSLRNFSRTPREELRLLLRVNAAMSTTILRFVARGCRTQFPKWSLRFELVRDVVRGCLEAHGDRIVDVRHAAKIRTWTAVTGSVLGWLACWQYDLQLETIYVLGLEHLWLKSHRVGTNPDQAKRLVVLYFHGGGYAVGSPRMYIDFCSRLSGAIRTQLFDHYCDVPVDVMVANYHKLPEHPFPVPVEDALAMYEHLVTHEGLAPEQIVLAGDSAGAGLVLATLLRIRDTLSRGDTQLGLPLAGVVACPFADLTGDEPEGSEEHCILSRQAIRAMQSALRETLGGRERWGHASPVHCDLRDLPPVFVQAASLDHIFQHALRLVAKAEADGVANWELDVHEGVPHIFMGFPSFVLPYAQVGIQLMAEFIARQFRGELQTKRGDVENVVCKSDKQNEGHHV